MSSRSWYVSVCLSNTMRNAGSNRRGVEVDVSGVLRRWNNMVAVSTLCPAVFHVASWNW